MSITWKMRRCRADRRPRTRFYRAAPRPHGDCSAPTRGWPRSHARCGWCWRWRSTCAHAPSTFLSGCRLTQTNPTSQYHFWSCSTSLTPIIYQSFRWLQVCGCAGVLILRHHTGRYRQHDDGRFHRSSSRPVYGAAPNFEVTKRNA